MDFSVRLEKLEAGGGSASRDNGVLYQKDTESDWHVAASHMVYKIRKSGPWSLPCQYSVKMLQRHGSYE